MWLQENKRALRRARENKDFIEADRIRDLLIENHCEVQGSEVIDKYFWSYRTQLDELKRKIRFIDDWATEQHARANEMSFRLAEYATEAHILRMALTATQKN